MVIFPEIETFNPCALLAILNLESRLCWRARIVLIISPLADECSDRNSSQSDVTVPTKRLEADDLTESYRLYSWIVRILGVCMAIAMKGGRVCVVSPHVDLYSSKVAHYLRRALFLTLIFDSQKILNIAGAYT